MVKTGSVSDPSRSTPAHGVAAGSAIRLRPPIPAAPMRCADVLVDALAQAGVDTVYGVPGGAISPIYDALVDRTDIRVVHVRHETNALFMAVGHTRMRPGALPCVLVTSGPGVTNAVTGLAAALGEGASVLVLGGEVPKSKFGRHALQEGSAEAIDVVGMVRSVTRYAETITLPGRAAFQLAAAARAARSGRGGPAFLSLPLDVAMAPVHPARSALQGVERRAVDPSTLQAATVALRSAVRPLVLVGSGARGAAEELRALVGALRLPVITSPKAKGIVPEDDPLCLGVFGYGGHPSTLEWLRAHPPDVVLALGCGFSEPSTNSWSPLLQASRVMIQVDVEPAQFGRNYRTDLAVQADCADVVSALRARLADQPPWDLDPRGVRYIEPHTRTEDRDPLSPARVLTVLQEEVADDTVFTCDIGEHLLFAIHHLRLRHADQLIASLALGSMGSGINAAIGAKLAAPQRTVVSISGDYGFQMYGMELNTCVQEGLGVVFVILNDDRMRMVEAGIERIYGRGLPMHGPSVDFAALARAHGADGAIAHSVESLRTALRAAAPDRPLVIDVRIDPTSTFPVNARVQEISNFTAG